MSPVPAEPAHGSASAPTPGLRLTLSRELAESTAAVLRVVSDPTRLQILGILRASPDGAARVSDLTRALGLRQPTVSHHVKVMREAGILNRRPEGREVWYAIDPARLDAVGDLLR
ncbi:metalloregulator ArsR/SmtB family transcription factor [Isoptericola halotolerans]|uniref:ArsR/SmtB family transcription factor n=1 Tax=Isoptericola halotolerans TaxID=300560 RepID=UPI00388D882E